MREKLFAGITCLALSLFLMGCPLFEGPVAAFNATPTEGNVPLTVLFIDQSQPGSADLTDWHWDFGDGTSNSGQNPSHVYTKPGVYRVTLSVTSLLGIDTETKIDYITVRELPKADFTASPRKGEGPLQVTFTNISTPGAAPITQQEWDFGDGTTSENVNPVKIYEDPGVYTVRLKVTTAIGDSEETKANYITVQQRPVASFTASPRTGSSPLTVQFSDKSARGSSPITEWFWDFGDGSTDIRQNPSHKYTAAGSYTVSLTVTSEVGGSPVTTEVDFIEVVDLPVANFSASPTTGSAPLNVVFTDLSTAGSDSIVAWLWDFGDSTSSTLPSPSHRYASDGVYDVSLTVTTSSGNSNTRTRTSFISAQKSPVAAFSATPRNGQAPLTAQFKDLSTPGSAPITSWRWDFGDGSTSNDSNPFHSYTASGRYKVTLSVTTAVGTNTAEQLNYITVEEKPTAAFSATPTSGAGPLTVLFADQSTAGSSAITTWAWDFGDGTSSTQQNPTKTYNVAGIYTVTLSVTSPAGTDTESKANLITVKQAPVAEFSARPTTGPAPLTVLFTDESVIGTESRTGWQWDFGDGTAPSTLQNPSHNYSTPGIYTVSLTASSSGGVDSKTKTDYLTVRPAVNFTGTPVTGVNTVSVAFTDTTAYGPLDVTTRTWDFGDGATSNEASPVHIYNAPGVYSVKLTVATNLDAQTDSRTRAGYVVVKPEPAFTADTTTGDGTLLVNFTNTTVLGDLDIIGVLWDFGDATTSQSENPSHNYTKPGTYTVKLTVTTAAGSQSTTVSNMITVRPVPSFSASATTGSAPLTVSFTNTTVLGNLSITGRQWNFGDGSPSSTDQNPIHDYTVAGSYDVTLTLTTNQGVVATTTEDFIVITAKSLSPEAGTSAFQDSGNALLELADGNFLVAGSVDRGAKTGIDAFVAMTDSDGVALEGWPKYYGGTGAQHGTDIVLSADGGYLLVGSTETGTAHGLDVYVLKLDAAGSLLWEQTIGGAGADRAQAVAALRGGGYVIAGQSDSPGSHGGVDAFIVTVDAEGGNSQLSWHGGAGDEMAYDVIEVADGGLLFVGDTGTFGDNPVDVYIVELNPDLSEVSSVTVGGPGTDGARGVVAASDGGYVVVGSTTSLGAGSSDVYLFKVDGTLAAVEWEYAYGGSQDDFGRGIATTADGGYILTGNTVLDGATSSDILLVEVDRDGVVLRNTAVGGDGAETGTAAVETSAGDVGVAGVRAGQATVGGDGTYVLKFDTVSVVP